MKKFIIAIAVSGVFSLGFTLINKEPKTEKIAIKEQKIDFSRQLNEKRLASWD